MGFDVGRVVSNALDDIQLKFDGEPVRRLKGAPGDAVIASLVALQRMITIIGMRSEGHPLGARLKPSQKVKRDYALICRAPEAGSHIQPFNISSRAGVTTPAAAGAREKLLRILRAFDSGSEEAVAEVLPNARERWFMAHAAMGLLPVGYEGLDIVIRTGLRGPHTFKADRAKAVIERYVAGPAPEPEAEEIAGKIRAIDYGQTILTVKPSSSRAVRLDYPDRIEVWLQKNVRKRIKISGIPKVNHAGDVVGFVKTYYLSELEPTLDSIKEFQSGDKIIRATKSLSIPITYDYMDRMFVFQDEALGIDAYSETPNGLRQVIIEELVFLWTNYALAPDEQLASDALAVKAALNNRFREET